jgi:hypothetical protein
MTYGPTLVRMSDEESIARLLSRFGETERREKSRRLKETAKEPLLTELCRKVSEQNLLS